MASSSPRVNVRVVITLPFPLRLPVGASVLGQTFVVLLDLPFLRPVEVSLRAAVLLAGPRFNLPPLRVARWAVLALCALVKRVVLAEGAGRAGALPGVLGGNRLDDLQAVSAVHAPVRLTDGRYGDPVLVAGGGLDDVEVDQFSGSLHAVRQGRHPIAHPRPFAAGVGAVLPQALVGQAADRIRPQVEDLGHGPTSTLSRGTPARSCLRSGMRDR